MAEPGGCHHLTKFDIFFLWKGLLVVLLDPVHCHKEQCWHSCHHVLKQPNGIIWHLLPHKLPMCGKKKLTYTPFHQYCTCFYIYPQSYVPWWQISVGQSNLPRQHNLILLLFLGLLAEFSFFDISGCHITNNFIHSLPANTEFWLKLFITIPFNSQHEQMLLLKCLPVISIPTCATRILNGIILSLGQNLKVEDDQYFSCVFWH